ncbi:MAG: helix-turn-helix transcriptional regulator [Bacteroidetes bacterium]|nr:helix-turn-helix transcriptional regulator [Bacteroidota bacterium]
MEPKPQLTKREKEIFELFRKGFTSKECAEQLYVSYHTVEAHRKNIHQKLGTHKIIKAFALL